MRYLQNIINRIKNTYVNIKTYLTQPLHDRAGRVVGNRITIFGRDIREAVMLQLYRICINKISMIVIIHVVTVVKSMYKK